MEGESLWREEGEGTGRREKKSREVVRKGKSNERSDE
jgi:hypothetical protein